MNIYKNGYIVDTVNNINIASVTKQVYLNSFGKLGINTLMDVFKGDIVIPVFRLYLLYDNEQVRMDASEDFISGDLSIQYQSGQRRSMNITLANIDDKWNPKPITGLIWTGSKFRLDTGILIKDTLYWKQQGVFLVKDPQSARENSNQTISLSLCDKFGLLDGTVYGRTSLKTIVPVGVPMYQAFNVLLNSDRGNGVPFDFKPILFNTRHKNTLTYYTIKQEGGNTLGEIFTDMGDTISSDVYYNEFGNMIVKSIVNEFISANFPVVYRFNENDKDIISASINYNTSQTRNKITVKGAIVNGYQFSATAKNRNPKSDYCIQYNGEIPEYISDSKLYADELCMDRAMYELINYTRGSKTLNLSCTYLPVLDINQSVLVYYPSLGLYNENYIIDAISMSISSDAKTVLTLTNTNEVIF
ncbi:MAG: hypothetical protein MR413_01830 [Clostridia bacterium]|nr:hypothetical protein [Clostridia bacterium]